MVEQTEQNALMAAAEELFEGTSSTVKVNKGAKVVTIHPATVRRMREMSKFMEEFIQSIPEQDFFSVITAVSNQQKLAIENGESPYKVDSGELVKKSLANAGGILSVLSMALERLGPLTQIFTDLADGEFDELEIDDATSVVLGVFGRNYHFFTQTVLPQIHAYIAILAARQKTSTESEKASESPKKVSQRK